MTLAGFNREALMTETAIAGSGVHAALAVCPGCGGIHARGWDADGSVQASTAGLTGITVSPGILILSRMRAEIDALIGRPPDLAAIPESARALLPTSGDDVLVAASGGPVIVGGDGNDRIFTGSSPVVVDAGSGADTIVAGAAADTVDGGAGNDVIWSGPGTALVRGGDGDDLIIVTSARTSVTGGEGRDTVVVLSRDTAPRAILDVEEIIYLDEVLPSEAVASLVQIPQRNVTGAPPTILTYAFIAAPSPSFTPSHVPEGQAVRFAPLDSTFRQAFGQAARLVEQVVNVQFQEVEDASRADFVVGRHNMVPTIGGYGGTALPGIVPGAPLMINSSIPNALLQPGNRGFVVIVHELGHVLGLGHPFDGAIRLAGADLVNGFRTLMSYGEGAAALGLMPYDIEALRAIYGATPVATGDDIYPITRPDTFYPAIVDDGGIDTLDAAGFDLDAVVDLDGGRFSRIAFNPATRLNAEQQAAFTPDLGNLGIARGTVIENVVLGGGADLVRGNAAANRITVNAGNDTVEGRAGNDTIEGGAGTDTAILSGPSAAYQVIARGTVVTVQHRAADDGNGDGTDTLIGVEVLRFADRTVWIGQDPFAVAYTARNPDLLPVFRLDADPLVRHFIDFGRGEGRQVDVFSVEAYAARNPDLFVAFGLDATALIGHWQGGGRAEGRPATGFSAEAYAARNPDLYAAFGMNNEALITHFIQFGRGEGRGATGFSAEAYAARNPDLFASYGLNADALVRHFVTFGRNEGRQATGFTASEYAALNPDLFAVFGLNTDALVRHYVQFGRAEGRQASLDQPAMALAEPLDLLGLSGQGVSTGI
ncbi:MAG: hypothetical protein RLY86_23 [Pseudomonadota bacterium]|jgi:Ca2+-binding RTX toxin-like protein